MIFADDGDPLLFVSNVLMPSPGAETCREEEAGCGDRHPRLSRGMCEVPLVVENDDNDGNKFARVVSDDHDNTPRLDSRTLERVGVEGYNSSPR